MRTDKDKPARVLRDGNIKVVIWKNPSEKGAFYSVQFVRTYKDGDNYHDTDSFSGSDVLKVAHLASKAYDAIAALRNADREEQEGA